MKTNLILILSFIFLTSCSYWSEEDSEKYMELCEKSKFEKDECECHLEKIKKQFSSFDEISENENQMPEIWGKCWIKKENN